MRFFRFCERHKFLTFLLALFVLGSVFVIFHRPILLGIGNYLLVSSPLEKADVIRVLGGSPDRYLYGFDLYKRGYAPKIIFSMWDNYLPLIQKSLSQIVKEYAESNGVPADAVEIISAVSTYHEAEMTRDLIEQRGYKSVLLVSSPYHMLRASIIFDQVVGERAKLIYTPVPDSWTDYQIEWWNDEESSVSVLHEYISMIYYFFKYTLLQQKTN